jgi:hypothetical protein
MTVAHGPLATSGVATRICSQLARRSWTAHNIKEGMMLVHPKRRMKRGFVRFFMDSLLGPYTALTQTICDIQ